MTKYLVAYNFYTIPRKVKSPGMGMEINNIRKKELYQHVNKGDLFGTLATLIDIDRQKINPCSNGKQRHNLEKRVEELKYLQDNYKIIKK